MILSRPISVLTTPRPSDRDDHPTPLNAWKRRDVGGRHRVVVIGGGFGGLAAAVSLARLPVEVTLIDRRNFHLFQPLTYQVATGALSPGEITYPLRAVFKGKSNVRVVLANVSGFDPERRQVLLDPVGDLPAPSSIAYDTLIVAGGSDYSYFGHPEWRPFASEVKSLESALMVRNRIFSAFEAAELENDRDLRQAWLTFVIVGAGPTGVETAGQIAELAHDTLRANFREADPQACRIVLVEAAERVLTTFPPSLSRRAARSLTRLGVTLVLGRAVVGVDGGGVTIAGGGAPDQHIPARTVVWAAGVAASPLASYLSAIEGSDGDRAGRVFVEPDLTLRGHPEIFAIGDMVRVRSRDGQDQALPGVAPVAIQQGHFVASCVRARLRGHTNGTFHYRDKGNLATIGRARAVADIRGLKLSGFLAWVTWLVVHLWYLAGFQNRLLVVTRWSFSFLTRNRGSRLITGQVDEPGARSRP
jgi:NADH:ubiquinone reductase (H+-translocating)